MKVAVACSCYKRLQFTKLCVPLAMANAGMDAQWLLIDDGSQDGTSEFLTPLAKNGSVEVRCYIDNGGMFPRRNEGLRWGYELGADIVVNLDNDLLLPMNWLKDVSEAMRSMQIAVGGPWFVNDKTVNHYFAQQGFVPGSNLNRWIMGICGGTCAFYKKEIFERGLYFPQERKSWTYGDAKFHGDLKNLGLHSGIYLGVQGWRVERLVWDPELEAKKIIIRTLHRHGTKAQAEQSIRDSKKRMLSLAP